MPKGLDRPIPSIQEGEFSSARSRQRVQDSTIRLWTGVGSRSRPFSRPFRSRVLVDRDQLTSWVLEYRSSFWRTRTECGSDDRPNGRSWRRISTKVEIRQGHDLHSKSSSKISKRFRILFRNFSKIFGKFRNFFFRKNFEELSKFFFFENENFQFRKFSKIFACKRENFQKENFRRKFAKWEFSPRNSALQGEIFSK